MGAAALIALEVSGAGRRPTNAATAAQNGVCADGRRWTIGRVAGENRLYAMRVRITVVLRSDESRCVVSLLSSPCRPQIFAETSFCTTRLLGLILSTFRAL